MPYCDLCGEHWVRKSEYLCNSCIEDAVGNWHTPAFDLEWWRKAISEWEAKHRAAQSRNSAYYKSLSR